jgi:hypothetical protein
MLFPNVIVHPVFCPQEATEEKRNGVTHNDIGRFKWRTTRIIFSYATIADVAERILGVFKQC